MRTTAASDGARGDLGAPRLGDNAPTAYGGSSPAESTISCSSLIPDPLTDIEVRSFRGCPPSLLRPTGSYFGGPPSHEIPHGRKLPYWLPHRARWARRRLTRRPSHGGPVAPCSLAEGGPNAPPRLPPAPYSRRPARDGRVRESGRGATPLAFFSAVAVSLSRRLGRTAPNVHGKGAGEITG